jgi:ketosteroid isomerase-like protein
MRASPFTSLAGWLSFSLCLGQCVVSTGCATRPAASPQTEVTAIRSLLTRQLEDWNAGNLAGFMAGYAKSESTHFASGGTLHLGWQAVFDRYRLRYKDAAAMGKTTFSDLEVSLLAPDAATAFGRWHQKGAEREGSGLFTLILRKGADGWKITHDHTSVGETK